MHGQQNIKISGHFTFPAAVSWWSPNTIPVLFKTVRARSFLFSSRCTWFLYTSLEFLVILHILQQ